MIGESLLLVGCVLILLAAIGVLRFNDVLNRMHALTKATTLGLLLALIGAAVVLDHPNDVTSVLIAAVLQLMTSTIAANLLARSTYLASGIKVTVDDVDELADGASDTDGKSDRHPR